MAIRVPRQRGMTLVELAIAIGLSAAVALTVWQLLNLALRLASAGAGQASAQQAVRIAIDRVTDQVRQAEAVSFLHPHRLVLRTSAPGPQSVVIAPREDGALTEWAESSGGSKLLIDSKDAVVHRLVLEYFDGQGRPAGLAEDVRLVRVALTVQASRGRRPHAPAPFTVTTMVRLRREP